MLSMDNFFWVFVCLITASVLEDSAAAQCSRTTPPCNLVCHCQSESQCPVTGCGTVGCQRGWDGPTCQRENVVLDLSNTVSRGTLGFSSYLTGNYAALAFDGLQTSYFTTFNQQSPYLWVNLGSAQTVYVLSVTTSAYDFQTYVNSNASRLGATLCTSNNAAQTTATRRYVVTCNQPLNGQYVWITRPGSVNRILRVTEMEIYKCSDYWFGVQCDKPCNCQTRNEVCNRATGECSSGCPAEYARPDCQDCKDGRYGTSCSNTCGNCKDGGVCDKDNGYCRGGCKDGYAQELCQECIDGRYGLNCSQPCGHCIDDKACDKTTGVCPGTCAERFAAPMCTDCVDGYYGPDCSFLCGDCFDGSHCNKTDGSCSNGCNPGSCPPLCKITAVDSNKSPETPSLPAGYIGAVAVLAVISVLTSVIAVVFYMKARRITRLYQEQVKAKYANVQVKGGADNTPTPDAVYEEMTM